MADKIVSWGGIESKSTSGMGITGSLSLTGDLNFQPGATRYISMSASPTTASGNSIVIQAGDAIASGTGGSISIQPGGGAGGPGAGTVTISNTTWWNGATVNGLLTVTNQGPNTGTALTVNAGGGVAMKWDWDNINLVNTVSSATNKILRFTGATQYQVRGSGTTSSTTALLVQNSAATENFRIYDNGNITIGLGTTTFSSIGGNGSAPSSSIYFDNYPNAHQVHHQIITRAAGQGNSYNYLRFPAAYDGVYQFIGAGGGVTLALTNSGSTAVMNYNHNGITTNASNAPITIDPSARTLTYGGGLNDVNHLAPYLVILKGNRPLSSGLDAGGDVYILGGLPRSGSSGASGSIYLLGGTINISGSVVITGSLTVSGSITATVPTTSSYVCDGILSGNQTFATGSDVTIAFVDYVDPNGWLTSNQFKPTIAGYYSVSFGVWLQNPGVASNQVNAQMRKNTDAMIISQQPLNNGTGISLGGSRIVQMNGTTDYLDWTVFQGTVGSGTTGTLLQGSANGSGTWFSAFLLTQ
jgi:hypothetical protein